jgi:hypothetical protein
MKSDLSPVPFPIAYGALRSGKGCLLVMVNALQIAVYKHKEK